MKKKILIALSLTLVSVVMYAAPDPKKATLPAALPNPACYVDHITVTTEWRTTVAADYGYRFFVVAHRIGLDGNEINPMVCPHTIAGGASWSESGYDSVTDWSACNIPQGLKPKWDCLWDQSFVLAPKNDTVSMNPPSPGLWLFQAAIVRPQDGAGLTAEILVLFNY